MLLKVMTRLWVQLEDARAGAHRCNGEVAMAVLRDEEYDRGKKKKVKKSKRTSGGPNLFQEFANMKIQQNMKMNQIQSGNQPLRI